MVKHSLRFALAASFALLLAAGIAAPKAKWNGSIKITGPKSMAALKKQAKITAVQANRIALAAVTGPGKTVIDNELEVERGFLVYCVDIKVAGQKGEHEVLIDAGNGKVLAQQLEDDDEDVEDDD